MEFVINTASREPIYRQLAAQVREAVAQGRLKTGAKLTSVRELSRMLVVNPNTIARAYTELERDGVLHTRQGLGVFVAEPASDLAKSAKSKRIGELIDTLLTEAVYLGYLREDLIREVESRTEKFEWRSEKS